MRVSVLRTFVRRRIVSAALLAFLTVASSFFLFAPVRAAPDFTISANTTALSIPIGSERQFVVTVVGANGFSGNVNLVVKASSSAFVCWFFTGTNTDTLSAGNYTSFAFLTCGSGSGPAGSYYLTITGTGGSVNHSIVVNVNVTDFAFSGPSSISFNGGSSRDDSITIESLAGFSGIVTLSVTQSSKDLSVSCRSSVMSLSSGMSLAIPCFLASPMAGAYNFTLAGTFVCGGCYTGGTITHSITTMVTVSGPSVPGFIMSASPDALTLTPGSSNCDGANIGCSLLTGISNVTITSVNGFSGSVFMNTTATPDLAATISPTVVNLSPGSSANLTLSVSSISCALGSFAALAAGASGSLYFSSTVAVSLKVAEQWSYFILCTDQLSMTIPSGSSANATITVVSLNQFQGTVYLQALPLSGSVSCSLSNGSVNLVSTATSTMSCTSSSPGTSTVIVRGGWTSQSTCHDCPPPMNWQWTTSGSYTFTAEPLSAAVNDTLTFEGVTVTTSGSASIGSGKVSGTVSVTATNSSTGTLLFSKTYTITNLQVSNNQTRFVLTVAVSPYNLSADMTLSLKNGVWSASMMLTRQLDIVGHGTVDLVDFGMGARTFDSSIGSPLYNPAADLTADGTINIIDIGLLVAFYDAPDYS